MEEHRRAERYAIEFMLRSSQQILFNGNANVLGAFLVTWDISLAPQCFFYYACVDTIAAPAIEIFHLSILPFRYYDFCSPRTASHCTKAAVDTSRL